MLLEQLWDEGMSAFVTRTVPPPRALWEELRSERVVTYFGCLACDPARRCPPVQGWPAGGLVPVRELQGLSSPWYFSAVPKTAQAVEKYAVRGIGIFFGGGIEARKFVLFLFSSKTGHL